MSSISSDQKTYLDKKGEGHDKKNVEKNSKIVSYIDFLVIWSLLLIGFFWIVRDYMSNNVTAYSVVGILSVFTSFAFSVAIEIMKLKNRK